MKENGRKFTEQRAVQHARFSHHLYDFEEISYCSLSCHSFIPSFLTRPVQDLQTPKRTYSRFVLRGERTPSRETEEPTYRKLGRCRWVFLIIWIPMRRYGLTPTNKVNARTGSDKDFLQSNSRKQLPFQFTLSCTLHLFNKFLVTETHKAKAYVLQ